MTDLPERIVTIFGGSKCSESDPEYLQAVRVGELLAVAGFTICTGGFFCVVLGGRPVAPGSWWVGLGSVRYQFTTEPNRVLTPKVASPHDFSELERLHTPAVWRI